MLFCYDFFFDFLDFGIDEQKLIKSDEDIYLEDFVLSHIGLYFELFSSFFDFNFFYFFLDLIFHFLLFTAEDCTETLDLEFDSILYSEDYTEVFDF